MNLVGYMIGIAFWAIVGYLAPTSGLKLLCFIPILILAVLATRQLFKKEHGR